VHHAPVAGFIVWPLATGRYPSEAITYDSGTGTAYDLDEIALSPLRTGGVTLQYPR